MKSLRTTIFAIEHPRLIVRGMFAITVVLSLLAGIPSLFSDSLGFMPQVVVDTDPENMLPKSDPARVFHNEQKERFHLHDAVVLGIVNDEDANGVFNPGTLAKVYQLTEFAKGLEGVIESDLMAPSTMDSIEHTGPGEVRFDWLMAQPPVDQAAATAVRERAMRLSFLKGTMISSNGKALVIYIPIEEKNIAHEISVALRDEITRIGAGSDQFHIAGLPVAEDTFGIEMFVQMAISAPIAMLLIFILMWFFFRSFTIITSPMLVAMASALSTMALLILTGNTVHIMSSMIPIFIMPIAVLDAVHIISDFFDTYPKIGHRRETLIQVMRHLFSPMLFTSLTTAVGFASLALTPIPPVQVFGIFIAIGVLAAWLFTILFVPAYIMLLSPKRLEGFGRAIEAHTNHKGILARLGRMRGVHAKAVLLASMGLVAIAVIGIQKINVNDNPTKWFEESHEIRIADRVLNEHFGGTYDAYLNLQFKTPAYSTEAYGNELLAAAKAEATAVQAVFSEVQTQMKTFVGKDSFETLDALDASVRASKGNEKNAHRRIAWSLAQDLLTQQFETADEFEGDQEGDTPTYAETNLLEAAARADAIVASYDSLQGLLAGITATSREEFREQLATKLPADPLQASVLDSFLARQEQSQQVFKRPEMLQYIADLQVAMNQHDAVGKTNSLADIVKIVHRDLISGEEADYRIPNTQEIVGETLTQYQSSHRKDDLWHFVTPDFQNTIIWFQLKSGDNMDMQQVIAAMDDYLASHDAPLQIEQPTWFGLTYINVVWQGKMVSGMVNALLGSFVVVLIMMSLLFRSPLWGLLSMIPLTLTVALIYGVLGLIGKDYDMPVAVLSSLSLGLAVDYAIHFLARARELRKVHGSWKAAQPVVFDEPARAISHNVIIVGFGFLPLLLAPLVPYQTVGTLIASILLAAGVATLVLLPAIIHTFERFLFRDSPTATPAVTLSKEK